MKKLLSLLLAAALLVSVLTGMPASASALAESSGGDIEETPGPNVYDDGRARPSSCGRLQVLDGKLCSAEGDPVMLRGVSSNSLITAESFINEPLFRELAQDDGVNLFRLAMYTYGVGIVGYCTGGSEERHKQDIALGVELARKHDMYVLIDWHILSDGDPQHLRRGGKAFLCGDGRDIPGL